jgi:cation diffusion facilitator family transporter
MPTRDLGPAARAVREKMCAGEKVQLLAKGARAAKVSTYVTIMLTGIKAALGLLSGSIALLADAIHSLSDIFTSLAVWLGMKLSQRKPSEKFSYGFYRVETLAFLVVSIVVTVSGVQVLLGSLYRILSPSPVVLASAALSVAAVSAVVSYLLYRYKSRISDETNSQALQGEAKHSLVDVSSSALVFVGILVHYFGFPWAEGIAGLLIGLLTIRLGLGMGRDAVLVLLDACLKPELISQMRKIATEVNGVRGVHEIKTRRSGPFIFAEMYAEVDSAMRIDEADAVSRTIEERIRDSIEEVDSVMLHVEPATKDAYRIAIPVEDDKGLDSTISQHFGKSPYFILIDVHKDGSRNWFVVGNRGAGIETKKGIEAAHLLVRNRADVLVAKEIGEGPYHVLRDSSIQIFDLNKESSIERVLDAFLRKELSSLAHPKEYGQLTRVDAR